MNERGLIPKRVTILDKIKEIIEKITGYKEGKRFILDTEPKLRKYSDIELMKLASVEEKLKSVLNQNQSAQSLVAGIEEKEAEMLLQWVVQNAREGLVSGNDVSVIKDMKLGGYCGLGQGITGYTLENMGLSPNISNAYENFEGSQHSFVTVEIPISGPNREVHNKLYLVDTTYRQFFVREQQVGDYGYIKDKRFGNKVAPIAGYWAIQMPHGIEFSEKVLADGYIELTEENAKIYGDSFALEAKPRKDNTKVPNPDELVTGIDGKTYIQRLLDPALQREIDFSRRYFEMDGINIKTPSMKKAEMSTTELKGRKDKGENMAISYLTILSNQRLIPELFSDKRWQELSIDEKKEIIYSIFHIKNWEQLAPEYRIYILQELENINASMQQRVAYKIIVVDNEDFTDVKKGEDGTREIWINSEYLLKGIRHIMLLMPDGTQTISKEQLNNANVELFCSICHEGEHAKQEEGVKSKVNTREMNECLLNFLTNPDDKKQTNKISASENAIFYKLQPVEYYAFLNSENMTRSIFGMLQAKFGIDEGYCKWDKKAKMNGFDALAKKWNQDNNMKELAGVEYTVTGIRKKVINRMLENFMNWYGIQGIFNACEELNLDYSDYSPKMLDDWDLDFNEIEEI